MNEIIFYKYKSTDAITSKTYMLKSHYDAYYSENYGIHLGKDTASALLAPAALKDSITNDSTLEDGVRFYMNTKIASRSLTLEFVIAADTEAKRVGAEQFLTGMFYKGMFAVKLPTLSDDVFFLSYNSSQSYARSVSGHVSKMSVKVTEYNPTQRTLEIMPDE